MVPGAKSKKNAMEFSSLDDSRDDLSFKSIPVYTPVMKKLMVLGILFFSSTLHAEEEKSGPWEDSCVVEFSDRSSCIAHCDSLCSQHTMGMGEEVRQGCQDRTAAACTARWNESWN